ncbi:MAG: hypothetical protein ACI8PZ_006421 [Myxococcota bacterium]|jgi:uncharacterized protein (DUF486 family)
MIYVVVPSMLFVSSVIMALAWIGHIRFRHKGFWVALFASWFLVLPEYILNVSAIRYGHGVFSGGQMAAMNLSSGVICVALVSRFFLGEHLGKRQILGFVLMTLGVALVVWR